MEPTRQIKAGNYGLAASLIAAGIVLLAVNLEQDVTQSLLWWPVVPLFIGIDMLAKYAYARKHKGIHLVVDGWAVFFSILILVMGMVYTPVRHLAANGAIPTIRLPDLMSGRIAGFDFNLGSGLNRVERSGTMPPSEPFAAGDKLVVQLTAGSIRVVGKAGATNVAATYQIVARDRSPSAAEALAAGVSVVPRKSGTTLELEVRGIPTTMGSAPDFPSVAVDIEVTVPPEADVVLDSKFGSLKVEGVGGNVHAETKFGEVQLTNVKGTIYGWTAYGQVDLRDVAGTIDAGTDFGKVDCTLAEMVGPCRLTTKFGSVQCSVPNKQGLNYSLTAQTKRGRITSALPLSRVTQGTGATATAKVGTGQYPVDLQADFGEITINTR